MLQSMGLQSRKADTELNWIPSWCSMMGLNLMKPNYLPKVKWKSLSLSLTLWDPMDCSPPVSSFHGILQARILEWVDIPFSRGPSRFRDQTCVSCIAGRFCTIWATREAPPKVLSPNTIALEVRTSMDEFWDDKVIRSITENLFLWHLSFCPRTLLFYNLFLLPKLCPYFYVFIFALHSWILAVNTGVPVILLSLSGVVYPLKCENSDSDIFTARNSILFGR